MDEWEPDIDAIEEGLFETYVALCEKQGLSLSDFSVWVEDNFV